MARRTRTFSPLTRQATKLLGSSIQSARRERRWTQQGLAERIGVSLPTLLRIEQGDPSVGIGIAFEAATILGVPLFDEDLSRRNLEVTRIDDRLALLPKSVRRTRDLDDDF